jgi:PAS domain S-box-containing protein
MSILDLHPSYEQEKLRSYISSVSSGKSKPHKWTHLLKNGDIRSVSISGNSIGFGENDARIVTIEDITEKEKIKERLEEQQKQFRNLVEKTSDVIYRTDQFGNFVYANPNCEQLSGYSLDELKSMNMNELVANEYKERVRNFYKYQSSKNIANTKTEFPISKKNGETIWIEQTVDLIPMEDGSHEFVSVTRDITEKRILEKSLLRSEEKYRSIIENMELGLLEVDTEDRILKAYPKFCKLTGYREDELIGRVAGDIFLDEDMKEKMMFEASKRKTGQTSVYEVELKKKDGTKIWVMISGAPYYDEKNKIVGSVGVHLDITERKNIESQLFLLSQFPELNPYPVLRFKLADNELIYANKHANNFLDSIHTSKSDKKTWLKFVAGKKGTFHEFKWKHNTYRFNRVEEAHLGIINIYSTDITEIKELQNKLRGAIDKAESLSKTKDLFLANMSHEIRTPMNAIIGLSEVLNESDLTKFQRGTLDRIRSASDNLLHLINEILDLSKIESNKFQLSPAYHSLDQSLKQSIELFEHEAGRKDVELVYNSNLKTNSAHLFDRNRLNQVLTNLIGNAIKFTDQGQVRLKINSEPIAEHLDRIKFSVIDTGIGIPPEDLKSIFENFSQAKNNDEIIYGGTGLGLSIAKKILLLMDSDLKVESKLGEGSVFSFTLDLPHGIKKETDNRPNNKEEKTCMGNCKILVAEDNPTNQFLIQTILEKNGINPTIVSNGLEVLELLEKAENNFDLVLMDMRMPVLDGVETTWSIRNKLKNVELPIIALTANTSEKDRKLCIDAGMNEFIVKPFKPNELLKVIRQFIKQKSNVLLDINKLNESTFNDPVFKEKMINIFLTDTSKRCIEIKESLNSKDWERIKKIAHSIKPALNHLAGSEIVDLAYSIESKEITSEDHFIKMVNDFLEKLNLIIREMELLSQNGKK